MEYNTQRKKIIIPEYGRHIHQLVDYCMAIENDEERNKCANEIINIMGDLNPHLRDVPDFKHKLWDQLFTMSNFELKVDSPYPIPLRSDIFLSPKKMNYPLNDTKYRYYGSNVKKMIEVAKTWDDDDKREGLIYAIANQMKKNYLKWNKDQVEDNIIFDHIEDLSKGSFKIEEREALININLAISTQQNTVDRSRNNNRNTRNNNNRKKSNYTNQSRTNKK